MELIQLKKTSGSATNDFYVILSPDYEIMQNAYEDVDFNIVTEVIAKWRKWYIKFGILTTTQLTYLSEIMYEDEPQFIYSSTTYDVRLKNYKPGYKSATLEIIERSVI